MPEQLVDTFFTIAAGPHGEQTGFVVQGNRVARYGWASGRVLDRTYVTLGRKWPNLPEAFQAGLDAALTTPADDPWTLVFRGPQCLRLHPLLGTVAEVGTIAARFPGLPAEFASGVDAALPGTGANQVFLFRGGRCVLYDTRIPAVVETKSLADMWPGLQSKAPAFANGISAATLDPGKGEFHFFRGTQFTKGVLATRTITLNATTIDDTSWPGLVGALSAGFLYVGGGWRVTRIFDLDTRRVVEELPIDTYNQMERTVATGPDGRYLYLSSSYQSKTCVDTTTRTGVAQIPNEWGLNGGMAFSPDGNRLHLVYFVRGNGDAHLDTYRAGSFERLGRIPLQLDGTTPPTGHWPSPVVAASDDRTVFIGRGSIVFEVDVHSQKVRQGFHPNHGEIMDLALSPDDRTLTIANGTNGTFALDTYTGQVVRNRILPDCMRLESTPNRTELYCIPSTHPASLPIADPTSHRELHEIRFPGSASPSEAVFSPSGEFAYVESVSGEDTKSLAVIDVAAHRMVDFFPMPGIVRVTAIAYSPY
ncbi:hypothetical protein [Embleya scabrispora]|uniref:hypothetical protein n=1 Tax=Embleya scabrispora TaxID=159449 RepID=UPI0003670AD9|nr:hypothetical protein [Embleya scabrispora]MYS82099.1 hypothetical protein [Streptomyces sp. SID5474]